MNKILNAFKNFSDSSKEKQEVNARRTLLEELFQDYYNQRYKLYRMNFLRGIFFGFGSVLGGTLVIALVVWLLTILVNLPVAGDYVKDIRNTIQRE